MCHFWMHIYFLIRVLTIKEIWILGYREDLGRIMGGVVNNIQSMKKIYTNLKFHEKNISLIKLQNTPFSYTYLTMSVVTIIMQLQ